LAKNFAFAGDRMSEDLMRYDILAQHALRSVVRLALQRVVREGLPGEHHFFISFNTNAPGVSISPRLREKYPEDMTIVLQHQFWNLQVFDTMFEVELSFDNVPERLVIPFAAIKGFFDPSVQFGLQFEAGAIDEEGAVSTDIVEETEESDMAPSKPGSSGLSASRNDSEQAGAATASNDDSTVVSLDAFRKK
jgi:hypothetical protein